MNEQVYQHLVAIIKEHAIHVTVKDATNSQTFMYTIAGRTYNRIVPCMILCVNRPFDIYLKDKIERSRLEMEKHCPLITKLSLLFAIGLAILFI